jgi:uncharacterized delta-60 repeat protein
MRRSLPALISTVLAVGLVAFPPPARAGQPNPGSLDPVFGDAGRVDLDFGQNLHEGGVAFAMQPDGKLLVAGNQQSPGGSRFAVARYTPSGHFDETFATHGHRTIDASTDTDTSKATGVAVSPSGKIVLGGEDHLGRFVVVRLRPNGRLDKSFNGTGIATIPMGAETTASSSAVTVQADGKPVIAGSATHGGVILLAVARLRTDGTPDPTFSGDGRAKIAFGASTEQEAWGVTIMDDGRILAAGWANVGGAHGDDFALAMFRSNGTLDPQFSGDGRQTTDFGEDERGYKVLEAADGTIVTAGELDPEAGGCAWALARYGPKGGLDTGFGGDGRVVTQFTDGCDLASGLALQPGGKVIGVGSVDNGGGFDSAVARYRHNGTLDTTFSGDGKVVTDFGDGSSEYWDAAVTPAGKIVAGGHVNHPSGEIGNFVLARYIG